MTSFYSCLNERFAAPLPPGNRVSADVLALMPN